MLGHATFLAIAVDALEVVEVIFTFRIMRRDVEDQEIEHCNQGKALVKFGKR